MRFNNNKSLRIVPQLCFALLMAIFLCLLFRVAGRVSTSLFYLCGGLGLCALIYVFVRASYFGYDSYRDKLYFTDFESTETINKFYVRNKTAKEEFDKTRLKGYKLRDFLIYKSLVLYVSSKKKRKKYKKLRFDITFLSPKKTKLLKKSLDKVLRSNKRTA